MKKIISTILAITLALTMSSFSVFAGDASDNGEGKCTSIYFGKDTTVNGTTIYGRTEDYSDTWRKLFEVKERETYAAGTVFKSSEPSSDFTWTYPEKTLRYIFSRDSEWNDGQSPEPYAEIGVNEKNVAVTATVTLSGGKSTITGTSGEDPMEADGLDEVDLTTLVLMNAKTAREGVELLAKIIDEKGAAGREGTMISDPNETWYFQSLSGHQYVGYKCPENMLGFSPNATGNVGPGGVTDITDTENFIVSDDLITVAQTAGTFVGSADDPNPTNPTLIKVCDSYANYEVTQTSGRFRLGYGYLYDYTLQSELNAKFTTAYLNYFIPPAENKKYSLYEAMQLLACRGEGTEWSTGNPSGNSTSITNDRTQEAHIVEVRSDKPDEIATVEWLCMAPAEFGVYLPYYGSLITDVYGKYNFQDQKDFFGGDLYENTFWHVAKKVYNLAKGPGTPTEASRNKYGRGVRDFWAKYQKALIEQQLDVDKYIAKVLKEEGRKKAEETATGMSLTLAEQTYETYIKMIEELNDFTANPTGKYVPSFMNDEDAMPNYANLIINNAKVDKIKTKTYDGKAKTPAVKVTSGGKTLVKDTDYTLKYSKNKGIGKGIVTITGKGDFVGKKVVSFKIVPKATSIKSVKGAKKKMTIKWKKVPGPGKYQISYKAKGAKNWKTKIVSAKKTSLVIKGLKKGKVYQVKVRSFKKVNKEKYYSAWSATKTCKKVK